MGIDIDTLINTDALHSQKRIKYMHQNINTGHGSSVRHQFQPPCLSIFNTCIRCSNISTQIEHRAVNVVTHTLMSNLKEIKTQTVL